jgi:hypothetical protein
MYGLKAVPFRETSFSATCKAVPSFKDFSAAWFFLLTGKRDDQLVEWHGMLDDLRRNNGGNRQRSSI